MSHLNSTPEDPNTAPGWFSVEEPPALGPISSYLGDVPFSPQDSAQAWGTQPLPHALLRRLADGDNMRAIYPMVSYAKLLTFLKSHGIRIEAVPGVSTLYAHADNNDMPVIPVSGAFYFVFKDIRMCASLITGNSVFEPRWLLLSVDITAADELLKLLSKTQKGKGRHCYTYGDEWCQKDEMLEEIADLGWDDLYLDSALAKEVRECCESIFHMGSTTIYDKLKLPRRRGVILHGKPGNGKTLLAKIVANQTNASLYYITASKNSVDERVKALEVAYSSARDWAPAVVVLEEIDNLIDSKIRPHLLTILDGLKPSHGVLTIATTNHIEKLDPALTNRPNRFDRVFEFTCPTEATRARYLTARARHIMGSGPNGRLPRGVAKALAEIVAASDGFSVAHLQEVVVGAGLRYMTGSEKSPAQAFASSFASVRDNFEGEVRKQGKRG